MTAPFIEILSATDSVPYYGIPFPSGQITAGLPGSDLNAFLIGMRASFGFNESPHTFELDFIPSGMGHGHGASGNLPVINTPLEMSISGFYLTGYVTHADWNSTAGGSTVNIIVKDKRVTLQQYKMTTGDLGDSVPSGVVSVAREWRLENGITQSQSRTWSARGVTKSETEANDPLFREYQRIIEKGATYPQILSAIGRALGSGVANQMPSQAAIQQNIGQDINSLRWRFSLDDMLEVISTITLDTAYDWYWNMANDTVSLINKKTPFNLPESRILEIIDGYGGSGIDNVTSIAYGTDKLTEPTRVELLGPFQEGIMNSPLCSPIDGLDTPYDGTSSVLYFEAAWSQLSVGFYDAGGYYRTYVPSEKELQMAIKGIEEWSLFKIYQTENPAVQADGLGWNLPADAGSVAAQHPDFQSRLDTNQPIMELLNNPDTNIRVISNRRDENNNWTIEFFNRVASHASRHYGKSYVATNALIRDDEVYRLTSEAWTNIENQRQDATVPFVDDYEIAHIYGPMAPFFNVKSNKVAAHCKLPSTTKYGPTGEDAPASFMSWTEDAPPFNPSGDGSHYIPVQLTMVGSRIIDPRHNDAYSFDSFPDGTIWCQLPALAGSGTEQDTILASLASLTELVLALGQSGLYDIIDPRDVVVPYTYLTGVAVPVIGPNRYGQTYPANWASGTADSILGSKVIIDESLAPWQDTPAGTQTSIDKLNTYAFDKINATISIQSDSQFVDIGQVGLPRISFNTFATQAPNTSGYYGEREHGVNAVNISYGGGGLTTTYKAQSYYVTPRTPAPLGERTRARLEGIIQPIDFLDLGAMFDGDIFDRERPDPDKKGGGYSGGELNLDFERQEAASVIVVNNIFNETQCDRLLNGQDVPTEERYYVEVTRRAQFTFAQTNQTFPAGVSYWGHDLNSLEVTVILTTDDNTDVLNYNYKVDDQHTIIIDNHADEFTGSIMIMNREGAIRPTSRSIRNGDEITDAGVVCQDGYLNIGDACVYLHKRVDGEEFAYLTGGRKLNPGLITEVESINDDGTYNVSILGDAHGRWMCRLGSLNSVPINTGTQVQIAETGG